MKFVEYKLATGAMLTGYLRDETTEMPSYNTRPAVLILPGGGYRYCSPREADPVAVQFLQAGYHVFTLIYSTDHAPLLWQPLTEAASAILYLRRNAADLRIAADKITIVGFSAGAHLAASTALLWDAAPVQQALGITGTEARPNAVVLGYPVITSGKFAHRGSFENLCGADEALLADHEPGKPGAPRCAAFLHLAHRGRSGCARGKQPAAGRRPEREQRAV